MSEENSVESQHATGSISLGSIAAFLSRNLSTSESLVIRPVCLTGSRLADKRQVAWLRFRYADQVLTLGA
jgi:hypothetical protein